MDVNKGDVRGGTGVGTVGGTGVNKGWYNK